TMAILMGAFLIQGLVPGPSMLTPAPKGHLTLTLSMVWTIVVSNVITVAFCFLFLKQLVRITQIRGALLIPFILMLIAVGAFAEKNGFGDVLIVLLFGGLGWVMSRLGWPRPPLLLGLVLGPLAENKLFLSTDNYGIAWLGRPGVLILFAIIVAGLLVPIISARRRQSSGLAEAVAPEAGAAGGAPGLRLGGGALFCAGVVGLFAWGVLAGPAVGRARGALPGGRGRAWYPARARPARARPHRPAREARRRRAGARGAAGGGEASDHRDVCLDRRILGGVLATRLLAGHAGRDVALPQDQRARALA